MIHIIPDPRSVADSWSKTAITVSRQNHHNINYNWSKNSGCFSESNQKSAITIITTDPRSVISLILTKQHDHTHSKNEHDLICVKSDNLICTKIALSPKIRLEKSWSKISDSPHRKQGGKKQKNNSAAFIMTDSRSATIFTGSLTVNISTHNT